MPKARLLTHRQSPPNTLECCKVASLFQTSALDRGRSTDQLVLARFLQSTMPPTLLVSRHRRLLSRRRNQARPPTPAPHWRRLRLSALWWPLQARPPRQPACRYELTTADRTTLTQFRRTSHRSLPGRCCSPWCTHLGCAPSCRGIAASTLTNQHARQLPSYHINTSDK